MEKRILIIGSPGSGKSTLAHHLHKMYGILLYHMDIINWIDNKTTISQEELIEQLNQIIAKNTWIIDGNYSDTLPLRLKRATDVIWLKEPRWKCIYRVIKRVIIHNLKRHRIGGNPNTISFEFIKYVWQFPENNNEFIKLQQLKTQDHIKWVISNSSLKNL